MYLSGKSSRNLKIVFQHIKVIALSFAVTAMVISTMHYHSETIGYLEHAHEKHFTNNDLECPICFLTINFSHAEETNAAVEFIQYSTLEFFYSIEIIKDSYPHDLSRAPPYSG